MTTPASADAPDLADPADPADPADLVDPTDPAGPGDSAAATEEPLSVAMVTLGCARNEVDSDELAGRLAAGGFRLVGEPAEADTVVVNTCGFVDAAKKDSVDTLLGAADLKESGDTRAVVAVGCLAERYGRDLAAELPEADAVLGFDDYPDIAARLRGIVAGEPHEAHVPQDRRRLLPISPVERAESTVSVPGHGTGGDAPAQQPRQGAGTQPSDEIAGLQQPGEGAGAPVSGRTRLSAGPTAPVKLASGCDRRCTFCAIPRFRGSFVSRRPTEVLHEIQGLAAGGVREAFLVSENSTSYGKDLGDLRLLERLLPELGAVPDLERVRVSYLQPAEIRPGLLRAMATTPGVAPYFDLSVQHAAAGVLRRMRRFGDAEAFLGLLAQIRELEPVAGVRSNIIVGFPGETEEDVATLCDFLTEARLDAVGVFGYSDEEGTEAASFGDKVSEEEIRARTEHVTALAEELTAQRAEERVGEQLRVLVESVERAHPEDPAAPAVPATAADGAHGASEHVDRAIEHEDGASEDVVEGRAAHQGPEVDGTTRLQGLAPGAVSVGDVVPATVVGTDGVDLIAAPRPGSLPGPAHAPGSGSRGR